MGLILVTDDDNECRKIIQKALEREGHFVESANNVTDALNAIARKPFDLIVCDYKMPGKSALDLLTELHERDAHVPVLIISACADANTEAAAMRSGAVGLLHKPFRRQDLIQSVSQVLH